MLVRDGQEGRKGEGKRGREMEGRKCTVPPPMLE